MSTKKAITLLSFDLLHGVKKAKVCTSALFFIPYSKYDMGMILLCPGSNEQAMGSS
jgi:hypothetical protein